MRRAALLIALFLATLAIFTTATVMEGDRHAARRDAEAVRAADRARAAATYARNAPARAAADAAAAADAPTRAAAALRATRALHDCGERSECDACGALLWQGEYRGGGLVRSLINAAIFVFSGGKGACCKGGTRILGVDLNPPISDEYAAILGLPSMSATSRTMNNSVAFAAMNVAPSRGRGGLGMVETGGGGPGGVSLHGMTYCSTYGIDSVGGLNPTNGEPHH